MKEYKQVDLLTGKILESYILSKKHSIPNDYKECWVDEVFYKPKYDLINECWIETLTSEEIEELKKQPIEDTSTEDRLDLIEEMLLFMMTMGVNDNVE